MTDLRPQHRSSLSRPDDEALYRRVVEDLTESVVRWTPDGTRTFVNRAYCRYVGKRREELLGTPFFGPDEDAAREAVLERLAEPETGRSVATDLSRGPLSGGRWHEWTDHATYDARGEIVEILSVGRDVHEKVLQCEELAESEQRYRSLFEDSRDAILISGADRSIIDANQAAVELFEADSKEDLIGLDPLRLYEDPRERERLVQEVTDRGFAHDFELRLMTLRGARLTVLDTVTVARNGDGTVRGYRGLLRDVTEERRLAEQFRQSQRLDAIGRVAGSVAHDFNNLLTVIAGYADFGLVETSADDPLREHFEQIQAATGRATDLTRQLLAFSRRQELQPRRLDLNRVIGDFQELLRPSVSEDILLRTVFAPDLWPVEADPGRIEQVLMNLVLNARDAMPDGGRLVIETRNVRIEDRLVGAPGKGLVKGDYVVMLVSDTGCGMDPATLAQVFEPFFTTKDAEKGTGLGLATVYGIVKQSGGSVLAYSEPGEGSVFKVYLPRAAGGTGSTDEVEAPSAAALTPATVLLVDDEPSICSLGARILEARGIQVLTAGSPAEALQLSDEHEATIDVLLTDLVLPGMDGLELAERLSGARPALAVIVMSGYSEGAGLSGRELPDGVPFLGKPFSAADLTRAVAAATTLRSD